MLYHEKALCLFDTAKSHGIDCAVFDCSSNMVTAFIHGVTQQGIKEAEKQRWLEFVNAEDLSTIHAALASIDSGVFSFRIWSPSRASWQRVAATKEYHNGYQFCVLSIRPLTMSDIPFKEPNPSHPFV